MLRADRRVVRVLAADDSAVMRGILRTVFEKHAAHGSNALPAMELCAVVRDGAEALAAVELVAPDVLLLDLEMPKLDGLGVLARLRTLRPGLPVILCSAYSENGARATLDALALGAKDYVTKPSGDGGYAGSLKALTEQLLPKIAALVRGVTPGSVRANAGPAPRYEPYATARVEVVVVGVSTGGPSALEAMLPLLPADFAVPVMIVQHMPKLFTRALAERLDRVCKLAVKEAVEGAAVVAGEILLAPGDAHMEVAGEPGRRRVLLHQGQMLNSCRPSVDYLFMSAARLFGEGALGLVMTGMGQDGLDGARCVRAVGGEVLAQDEATSAVWGMPGRVVQSGLANATLPLGGLAAALRQRVQAGRETMRNAAMTAMPERKRMETQYGLL